MRNCINGPVDVDAPLLTIPLRGVTSLYGEAAIPIEPTKVNIDTFRHNGCCNVTPLGCRAALGYLPYVFPELLNIATHVPLLSAVARYF